MSLVHIHAIFECDGCGQRFKVEMDPATMRPKGWTLMQEAEDYCRGGVGADGNGMPAVIHDMHLCHDCAAIAASVRPEEDDYAPKEEIQAALARANDAMLRTAKRQRSQRTEKL